MLLQFLNVMVDSSKPLPNGDMFPNGDMSFFWVGRSIDWKHRVDRVERRSVRSLKYFFINFKTAIYYPPDQEKCLCVGRYGQERDAPELAETIPYDPFKLDVYQLGMIIPKVSKNYEGMEFLKLLHEAMTREDPAQRPTVAEAKLLFKTVISSFTEEDMSRTVWTRADVLLGRRRRFENPKPKLEDIPNSSGTTIFFHCFESLNIFPTPILLIQLVVFIFIVLSL